MCYESALKVVKYDIQTECLPYCSPSIHAIDKKTGTAKSYTTIENMVR